MSVKNAILLGVAGLFLGAILIQHGPAFSQTQELTVKKVPIMESQADSGKQMFRDYCAACHGLDGRGNGPAASALACKQLPDLTTLAKRNNAKSAGLLVKGVLEFGTPSKAHGTPDMPVWGPLFRSLGENSSIAVLREKNICDYVDSLQVK